MLQGASNTEFQARSTPAATRVNMIVRLADGGQFAVSGPAGSRAVDALRAYGLPLKPDCAESCPCMSCHARVADAWAERLATPNADERATMMRAVPGAGLSTRLLCRLELTPDLDGLDIEIAAGSLVPQTSWVAG